MSIPKLKGIQAKLIFLAGFSGLAFLGMASWAIVSSSRVVNLADRMIQNQKIIVEASKLAAALEKEYGLSALFLSDGIDQSQLEIQKKAVDNQFNALGISLAGSAIGAAIELNNNEIETAVAALRKRVLERALKPHEVIEQYSAQANKALRAYTEATEFANQSGNGAAAARLLGLTLLEQAGENAAQLRATLSAAFRKNTPMNKQNFNRIAHSRAGIELNLGSPALLLKAENRKMLEERKTGRSWALLAESSQLALRKADEGEFGEDASAFFETASSVMTDIKTVLENENRGVEEYLSGLRAEALRSLVGVVFGLLAVTCGLSAAVWMISGRLNRRFNSIASDLRASSEVTNKSSADLVGTSKRLAFASVEQAGAIRQTVATLNGINTIVSRSQDRAVRGANEAEISHKAAQKGKQAVEDVISSLQDISASNEDIVEQIETSHAKFSDITRIISEIGTKTKIINDIVFQTRLLAFNASIEAARAGEQGKGFSVVAEEMAGLARLSGEAAREINAMLEQSTTQVVSIVSETKTKVSSIVLVGKEKVEAGTEVARSAGDAIEELVGAATKVNNMVTELSFDAKEQFRAVSEVTRAMHLLETRTQGNASIAEETARHADRLSHLGSNLSKAVGVLETEISGKETAAPPAKVSAPAKIASKSAPAPQKPSVKRAA